MIAELGHFALVLALFIGFVQIVLPLIGAHRQDESLMRLASVTAVTNFILVAISFAAIAWSFLISDFSVRLVAANSEINKPTIYKITGVWANHEGSMLLWVLILSLFAAAIAVFGNNLPLALKARGPGMGCAFRGWDGASGRATERGACRPAGKRELGEIQKGRMMSITCVP